MNLVLQKKVFSSLLAMSFCLITYSQHAPRFLIDVSEGSFYAQVDNYFQLIAQQDKPVSLDQLSATLQADNNYGVPVNIEQRMAYFLIHPDKMGTLKIKIRLKDTTLTKAFRVKPIPVIGMLSQYSANTDEQIGAAVLKAQIGVMALVNCCGFDARCEVLKYEVIRINSLGRAEKTLNAGGSFEEKTRAIIHKAEAGDLYIFRKIRYRCFENEASKRLDDMIFEIKL